MSAAAEKPAQPPDPAEPRMRVRYSYLPEQFADIDDLWAELKAFVATGDFTLGQPLTEFEGRFAERNGSAGPRQRSQAIRCVWGVRTSPG